jgi:hypothetical protein
VRQRLALGGIHQLLTEVRATTADRGIGTATPSRAVSDLVGRPSVTTPVRAASRPDHGERSSPAEREENGDEQDYPCGADGAEHAGLPL